MIGGKNICISHGDDNSGQSKIHERQQGEKHMQRSQSNARF